LPASPATDEAGRFERRLVVPREHLRERLPAVRRIADAEFRRDRARQTALLEVLDGAGRLFELRPVELRRLERDRGQVEDLFAAIGLAGAFDLGDLETGIAGELLHGVGKLLPPCSIRKPMAVPWAPHPKQW
jgi:hypothetical protein